MAVCENVERAKFIDHSHGVIEKRMYLADYTLQFFVKFKYL